MKMLDEISEKTTKVNSTYFGQTPGSVFFATNDRDSHVNLFFQAGNYCKSLTFTPADMQAIRDNLNAIYPLDEYPTFEAYKYGIVFDVANPNQLSALEEFEAKFKDIK